MSKPNPTIHIRIPSYSPLMGVSDGNVWVQMQMSEENLAVLELRTSQFSELGWAHAVSIDVSTLVCWPGLHEEHFGPTFLELSNNPEDTANPLLSFKTSQIDGARFEQAITEPINLAELLKHYQSAVENNWRRIAIMPGEFYDDDIDRWPQNLQRVNDSPKPRT